MSFQVSHLLVHLPLNENSSRGIAESAPITDWPMIPASVVCFTSLDPFPLYIHSFIHSFVRSFIHPYLSNSMGSPSLCDILNSCTASHMLPHPYSAMCFLLPYTMNQLWWRGVSWSLFSLNLMQWGPDQLLRPWKTTILIEMNSSNDW